MPRNMAAFRSLGMLFIGVSVLSADVNPRKDLARVGITRYQDITATGNFGYMPKTLAEAIDASLQGRFEYLREAPEKTETAAAAFSKTNGRLGRENIVEFCRRSQIEIAILGSFAFDAEANEIIVNTSVSLCRADAFRVLEPRRNRIDATIFQLADHVADDIVRELMAIALEQSSARTIANRKEGERVELKKDKSADWQQVRWSISPLMNLTVPINSSFKDYHYMQAMPELMAEYRLFRNFHAALMGAAMQVRAANVTLDLYSAAGYIFYYRDMARRWRMGLGFGGGYYYGRYNDGTACSETSCTAVPFQMHNPYASMQAHVKFLLWRNVSIGIFGQGDVFFDGSQPLVFGGGGVVVGAHF